MKKMILSLMSATLGCAAFAANCVSVKQIGTDYANHQITIALTRNGCTGDGYSSLHRNTVWVFVDYRTVTGATKGAWTRATISAVAGTVVNSGSSKGAWINGANGTQTVTLTLSGMPEKYDWCAFATDYPPNVVAAGGVYTFKGTPPFVLQPATGSAQTVTQTTLAAAALTVAPVSIMDATGCTGTFCPYSGSDLYIDATHVCQQRTGGAKNWEAWIKDTRDNELYRIVYMPDNKWWLAQNVKYAGTGSAIGGCTKDECGRMYNYAQMQGAWGGTSGAGANKQGVCPNGWVIPVCADWTTFVNAIGVNNAAQIRPHTTTCEKSDYYGWAPATGTGNSVADKMLMGFPANQDIYNWDSGIAVDYYPCSWDRQCSTTIRVCVSACGDKNVYLHPVRCYRQ